MRPTRISDLAYRAMLNVYYVQRGPLAPDEAAIELVKLLNSEAQARDFKDWEDAYENFRVTSEIANDATPFEKIAKERAIAMTALRKIDKGPYPLRDRRKSKRADQLCRANEIAHNALDEIGDDRGSDLG